MKRKITKSLIVDLIRDLDQRSERWSDEKVDRAIQEGFSELCTIVQPFYRDVTVELDEYYESGETKFIMNIPDDSIHVYDMYLIHEVQEKGDHHGETKYRNEALIYRDSKNPDVIHVDINGLDLATKFDTAVAKYFYIPNPEFDFIFMSNDVWLALKEAISASVYDMLNDVERAMQKRAGMQRTGRAINSYLPTDYSDPGKASMFPAGV